MKFALRLYIIEKVEYVPSGSSTICGIYFSKRRALKNLKKYQVNFLKKEIAVGEYFLQLQDSEMKEYREIYHRKKLLLSKNLLKDERIFYYMPLSERSHVQLSIVPLGINFDLYDCRKFHKGKILEGFNAFYYDYGQLKEEFLPRKNIE